MSQAAAKRIPPIQCLLTFEALARLRSVTLAADELFVTPSAVSHRVKQLEQILGTKLFGRADFSLTTEGIEYLAHVRDGLATLQKFPGIAGQSSAPGKRRLRVAVTPTFARAILIPRLKQFTDAYPEIELALQVSIPLLDVVAEDADLMIRFGSGRYADVEHVCLVKDEVTPLASPAFVREHGPFELAQDLCRNLLRSELLVTDLDFNVLVSPSDDLVRDDLFFGFDFRVSAAHKALDRVDRATRVGDRLAASGLTDDGFAFVIEGNDARCQSVPFGIGNDLDL